MATEPVRIVPDGPAGPIPTLVFLPDGDHERLPLVLMGHGGHLSKDDPIMQALCGALARVPAAVAIMDAPGHGERRDTDLDDDVWTARVLERCGEPSVHAQLVAEWPLVGAAARDAVPAISGPVAYAGFSMGSIFGMSIVGDLAEVRAAVFAVGGYVSEELPHAAAMNALIAKGIVRLGDRPVLMVNMTRDESFPIAHAIEMLDAIPGPRSMHVYVGGHTDLPPESMSGMLRFLRRALRD
jgi:pimeloyl-ACP methyl ester carboxylesterase